jgi:hypothetical protein
MVFVQYASGVNINDLRCASMWAGIASILPVSGAFDDYTVRNSKFGKHSDERHRNLWWLEISI